MNRKEKKFFLPVQEDLADFSNYLIKLFSKALRKKEGILFVCIGSTLIIGDSLGPKIGDLIKNNNNNPNVKVFGNFVDPVHALNLENYIETIKTKYKNWFIVAIDAALCDCDNCKYVIVKNRELAPGSGVGKTISKIGDISILGVVGKDPSDIYSTNLSDLQNLVNFISNGILKSTSILLNN